MTYEELIRRDVVDAYTAQRQPVLDKLLRGEVHRQRWRDTAAFDELINIDSREAHRRSYEFLTGHMPLLAAEAETAPTFLWFDKASATRAKRFHEDEVLLHLRVPVSELLFSHYQRWNDLLFDHQADSFEERTGMPLPKTLEGRHATIFEIASAPPLTDLQAVVDRLEPGWFVAAEVKQ